MPGLELHLSHFIQARVNSNKIPVWRLCRGAWGEGGAGPRCHFPDNKSQCIDVTLQPGFNATKLRFDRSSTCLNDSQSDSFIELSSTSGAR